jgi:acetylornithine/N-succinyldiaminopimelate aminotransferase
VTNPDFLKAVVDHGLYLESELQRISARHGLGEVRGRGLLLALDLKHPIGAAIVKQAMAAGVLLNSPQPDGLRFMPALNVSREEISAVIECLDTILTSMGAARRVA